MTFGPGGTAAAAVRPHLGVVNEHVNVSVRDGGRTHPRM
jgi:hypothetical protein